MAARTGEETMTDRELLTEYVTTGSGHAFGRLVERHTSKVYSACLGVLGDPHAAEDATQATFVVLTRKARRLRRGTVLSGWLYLTARNCALRLRRAAARRRAHERKAAEMKPGPSAAPGWEGIRPQIDDAIASLPAHQRNAVVLRYLDGKSTAEAAMEIGCSESSVTASLSRGIARLRSKLGARGATVGGAALVAFLTERAAEAAPVHLAAAVTAVCTGKAAASGTVVSIAEGTMRAMMMAKIKIAAAVVVATMAAGAGTGVMIARAQDGVTPGTVSPAGPVSRQASPTGTTYYMAGSPGPGGKWGPGSDANDGLSRKRPFITLKQAFKRMKGGDTLVIADGEYSGDANRINFRNYPPSGKPGALTVIRAENIPGQDGVPVGRPLAVRFTDKTMKDRMFHVGSKTPDVCYIKFWGLRWDGISTAYSWHHLYFKQVASQGMEEGNRAAVSNYGHHCLYEDVVVFGKGRHKFFMVGPKDYVGDNLLRRVIIRHDWANKDHEYAAPVGGFADYGNRGMAYLNCMMIDSDLPRDWHPSPEGFYGTFYVDKVWDCPMIIKGCLAINNAMRVFHSPSLGNVIEDLVAVRVSNGMRGRSAEGLIKTARRMTLVDMNTKHFKYRDATQAMKAGGRHHNYPPQRKKLGLFVASPILSAAKGSILDYKGYGETGLRDRGLLYPVRTEPGSALAQEGKGARVLHRLGRDGAFKGEPGWDEAQAEPLWPWPLEGWVRAELRTAEYTSDTKRGFCADGQTLSNYVWGFFGNTPPPFNVKAEAGDRKLTLTWDAAAPAAKVSEYKVHCGTRSGSYTQTRGRSVGRQTEATITGLRNGTKYYIAVTALGPKGESGYSYELAATPGRPGGRRR